MHVTDLPINKALGMQLAAEGDSHLLAMAESPLVLNHVCSIHASAQFALAEAASGEFLLCLLGVAQNQVFAVLRTSSLKFRKPAHGTLYASSRLADGFDSSPAADLASRGRALVSIMVEIADTQGVVTMTGQFDWFLQRASTPE